ncbi:hypothetical protein F8388_019081 [Cannabis sativa]|uniref:Uncharacterized protein n=1 Tax=Cannabis sativa TaxID=3483 RepID=A0A7J6FCG5_CANSA|nr:hypothetical protein F8388_019081 [Cannabis sativa]
MEVLKGDLKNLELHNVGEMKLSNEVNNVWVVEKEQGRSVFTLMDLLNQISEVESEKLMAYFHFDVVNKGSYSIPLNLGSVLKNLLEKYGDIGESSTFSPAMKSIGIFFTCKVLKQMQLTLVADINKDHLRHWYFYIIFAKEIMGFEVEFLEVSLKKITQVFFYRQVSKLLDMDIKSLRQSKMDELENEKDKCKVKFEKLREFQESSFSNQIMKERLNEGLKVMWKTVGETVDTSQQPNTRGRPQPFIILLLTKFFDFLPDFLSRNLVKLGQMRVSIFHIGRGRGGYRDDSSDDAQSHIEKEPLQMGGTPAYKEYVAGLLAGVSTVAIGHPFDTVKVKLQKHNTEAHGIQYKNGWHCTTRILRTEGIRGLYRGATSSFVGVSFESSLVFGIYSQTKQFLQGSTQSSAPQPHIIIPSAAYGGAIISFILCPSELIKCRMQIQGTDSLVPLTSGYSGPLDCAVKTVKSEGVKGIFRGGGATLLRESIGNAAFFSVYEYVRYHMHSQLNSASSDNSNLIDVGVGIISGGLGGIALKNLFGFLHQFWSAVLPLDVAKTIIQTSPDKNTTRNPFQILNSIYRRDGIKGCYTGLGPTICRAFPANAAAIVTWELAIKLLGLNRN